MVTIYATESCPRCTILKAKLQSKNIDYQENYNEEEMRELGIMTVPQILKDNKLMDFGEAISWINTL